MEGEARLLTKLNGSYGLAVLRGILTETFGEQKVPATSQQSEWLAKLPEDTIFRSEDVPGPTRGAVHGFLHRENAKPETRRRAVRIAANLYWKPGKPNSLTGTHITPDVERVGWALAGPHAGALGWYGANLVGWSTQIAVAVAFAVPGEPRLRHPYPGVELRGRRNQRRRDLTNLEATYIEAVIGFDRWAEFEWWHTDRWQTALDSTRINLRHRAADGRPLPRPDVMRCVAEHERPPQGRRLFRERVENLLDVFQSFVSDTAPAAAVT